MRRSLVLSRCVRWMGAPPPTVVATTVPAASTTACIPNTAVRRTQVHARHMSGVADAASGWSAEERASARAHIAAWVRAEVKPHVAGWEDAGEVPRDVYKQAGDIGLLGAGYPAEFGGTPMPLSLTCDIWEDVAHLTASGGVGAALGSHSISMPPILALGSEEMKQRVLPAVFAGEAIGALAVTEASGGSDVANIKTVARREGDHYVVSGSKMFITSGVRADYYTVAVGHGTPGKLSLLLVERGTPGFTQSPLQKQGWWCSDTAELHFDDVRVPASNLIGEEGMGFKGIMVNFNKERIFLAVQALGLARACYDEALQWARDRSTFGEPLINRQVIRHKLVDMYASIESTAALLAAVVAQVEQGQAPVATICVLKNAAVDTVQFVSNEGLQILGGSGYIRGSACERVYREVKVLAIGGGATEIMKDLAAKQLGY